MNADRELAVFHAFLPFYRLLNIFKVEKFRNSHPRCVPWNIFLAIVFSITLAGFTVSVMAQAWYCYVCNFELRIVAAPFGVMINAVQLAITYAAMMAKVDRMNAVVSSLQESVGERKS